MDLTFDTPEGRFNYRVCGIILHEGRLLAMKDQHSPYFYLPGGRVKMGETAEDAVLRELQEELGIACKINRPLWLNQGFFIEDETKMHFHELCLYFLMDISGTDLTARGECFDGAERDHRQQFTWLPLETLGDTYLYPIFVKTEIFSLPEHLTLRREYE